MTSRSKTGRELERLAEALDETPIDDEAARETVANLGIDVPSLAGKLRAQVAEADAADRKKRIDDARAAYAAEVERIERRKIEGGSREERLTVFRALLGKAPPSGVAAHFHKYESATDEELDELIRALEHLLEDDGDDD